MFLEREEETPQLVPWAVRASQLQAKAIEPAEGGAKFARAWNNDRHTVALTEGELKRLTEYLSFVSMAPDREVIAQDEQGDYLLIVLEGTIAVDRVQPWGGRARLGEARVGDLLGEMSLLDAGTRFSSCRTLTPCAVGVLEAHTLGPHDERRPAAGGGAARRARTPLVVAPAPGQRAPERAADQLFLRHRAPGETTNGTRPGLEIRQRPAAPDDLAQRLGPLPHRRLPARDQGRRPRDQGVAAAAHRPAHDGAGACGDERQASRRVRDARRNATSPSRRRASAASAATRSCRWATSAWCSA